jgi:hypothetical protein
LKYGKTPSNEKVWGAQEKAWGAQPGDASNVSFSERRKTGIVQWKRGPRDREKTILQKER